MATIKLQDVRKEMKNEKGTFFHCVNYLFSFENCPSLKKVLPSSKNKAKTDDHESACKKFVRYGETLERKGVKVVNGEKIPYTITYVKDYFTADEVLRYFVSLQ